MSSKFVVVCGAPSFCSPKTGQGIPFTKDHIYMVAIAVDLYKNYGDYFSQFQEKLF